MDRRGSIGADTENDEEGTTVKAVVIVDTKSSVTTAIIITAKTGRGLYMIENKTGTECSSIQSSYTSLGEGNGRYDGPEVVKSGR